MNHLAFIGALSVFVLLVFLKPDFIREYPFIFLLFYFVPIAMHEVIDKKVFLNETTGLAAIPLHTFSLKRLVLKYLGLTVTLAVVAFLYWLFPEYHKDSYKIFFGWIETYYLWVVGITFIYMSAIDRFMKDPYDAYWQIGSILSGNRQLDKDKIAEHARSWFIRAFFLPIMFGYLIGDLNFVASFDFMQPHSFKQYYDLIFNVIVIADLTAVVVGYGLVARFFNNNIRSTDPTVKGWLVCLICYPPIWSVLFYSSYFAYAEGPDWFYWAKDLFVWKYIWAAAILLVMTLYASASLAFGLRWSNLTYRGLITSGTYKITKHPAYVFKCISYWLMSVPFLVGPYSNWQNSLKFSIMLLGINFIYYLRAKAEERHLSCYPEYRDYAMWIEKHGWFRTVGRICPFIKFKPYNHLTENNNYV